MKANIKVGQVASVALNTLESYPTNPRRGDIEAIAQSLKAHGQYRPIVVQYGTNFILAGNHTYKAAKKPDGEIDIYNIGVARFGRAAVTVIA